MFKIQAMRVNILVRLIIVLMLFSFNASANDGPELSKQRETFKKALKALETNQLNLFQGFQDKLEGYPLQGYLQYRYLRHRLNHVSPKEVAQFLGQENNTFYAERLRRVWLQKLAKQKQWDLFLKYYQPQLSAKLDCYQLQGLMNTGQQALAFEKTPAMWLVDHSQDEICDPVFAAWQKHGLLTDGLRWQRMLMALRDNQFSLAKYLAKSVTNSDQALGWVSRWQQIHNTPLALLKQLPGTPPANKNAVSLARDTDLSREIILHGIARLARLDTEKAFQSWMRIKNSYQFNQQEITQARVSIGFRSALNREAEALKYYGQINGGEWHVRAALWQQNWSEVKRVIAGLPDEQKSSTHWQYWLGRAQAESGEHLLAQETFSRIINERDYYAFLAADQLEQSYQMNHRPILISNDELKRMQQDPAIQRLAEFYHLNMMLDARREAYYQRLTRTPRELQLMAKITHDWGWHNQTIAILGSARYWDALDLRFPVLFDTEVLKASEKTGLDPSWVLAIARQESAFNVHARSHAGAMGLMQLMPNTGRLIAKLINKPLKNLSELYRGDRNIELGSAYLKKMYDENQHNPVLATAAYNAGPHRVNRWLPETTLPADIWAENIPFNETRHYVKSVMSYAAIFDSQRNQKIKPLSDRMPAVSVKGSPN